MTALIVDGKNIFNFRGGIEDAEIWIMQHQDEYTDLIVVQEDEYDLKFQEFLDENAPVHIEITR